MEWIGIRIRRQRLRLGLTLDELSVRTKISKPYLSGIETGRMRNPPSDEKLRNIGRVLGLAPDILLIHAQLLRTPPEVRQMLKELISGKSVDEPTNQLMREILQQ